jgi:hemerythrin superfamily protein
MVKYLKNKRGEVMQKKIEKIKDAVKDSTKISEDEKSLMYQRLEEWRHEDEAMRLIPDMLAEISIEIRPILKEIGLL